MEREAAKFFPGVPVARLKSRYAEKKAKMRHWTPADVCRLPHSSDGVGRTTEKLHC